jgi:hypothetical protein
MREIVFRVHIDRPGHLEARAEGRPGRSHVLSGYCVCDYPG